MKIKIIIKIKDETEGFDLLDHLKKGKLSLATLFEDYYDSIETISIEEVLCP
jgi:hypothetical protein